MDEAAAAQGRQEAEAFEAKLRLLETEERDRRLDQLFSAVEEAPGPVDPPPLPPPPPSPPAAADPPALPPPLTVLAVLFLRRLRIIARRTLRW